MSRTDIHRPMWVLEQDYTIRHWFREEHDHSTGPCDFAEFIAHRGHWDRKYRCYFNITGACHNLCGCELCTGSYGQRYAHRQSRVLWREARQKALKMAAGDREDFDEGLLHGSCWY